MHAQNVNTNMQYISNIVLKYVITIIQLYHNGNHLQTSDEDVKHHHISTVLMRPKWANNFYNRLIRLDHVASDH